MIYELAIHKIFGAGNRRAIQLLEMADNPSLAYKKIQNEPEKFLNQRELKIFKECTFDYLEETVKICEKDDINIISIDNLLYPEALKHIDNPPIVLFTKGDFTIFKNNLSICIIGTRKPSQYGIDCAHYLASEIAATKAVIVSGLARGTDTAAHLGALYVQGKTAAVLACGMDIEYPKENTNLKKEIIKKGGCILTELFPGTKVYDTYFHTRNRIMSGLSQGLVIVEAPLKSGCNITANYAAEQSRDVFCVPPKDIFDAEHYGGVAEYLREGAIAVLDYTDVLMPFSDRYRDIIDFDFDNPDKEKNKNSSPISKNIPKVNSKSKPCKTILPKPIPKETTAEVINEKIKEKVTIQSPF